AAQPQSKLYGDPDPSWSYTATGFKFTDTPSVLTGGLTRAVGENVGSYVISSSFATANYAITYTPAALAITPAALTLAAQPQSKLYGDPDPSWSYSVTGFKFTDTPSVLTGALSRDLGEQVASYNINQGGLAANENYDLQYKSANLVILPVVTTTPTTPESISIQATTTTILTSILSVPAPVASGGEQGSSATINISVSNGAASIGAATITMANNGSLTIDNTVDTSSSGTSGGADNATISTAETTAIDNTVETKATADTSSSGASSEANNATTSTAETTTTDNAVVKAKVTTEKSSEGQSESVKQANAKSEGARDSSSTSSPSKSTDAESPKAATIGNVATAKVTTGNSATLKAATTEKAAISKVATTGSAATSKAATTASAATSKAATTANAETPKTATTADAATTSKAATTANVDTSKTAANSQTAVNTKRIQTTAQAAKLTASATAKTASAESSVNSSGSKTAASSEVKATNGSSSTAIPASVSVKAPPVSVATAKASLSDNMTSTKAGSNGVETLKTSLTDAAIKTGVPVAEAAKASDSFAQVLVAKLAAGMPMSVATAQAQNAFNSAISIPIPTTPQAVAANSLSGSSTASSLTALSGSASNIGSAAFEASLSASLANGNSLEQSIKIAQASAQQSEAAAKIDNSPRGELVNGAASTLTDTSPAFQNSLNNALAKGMTPEQALQRATTAANESSVAAKADENNPKTALSSGNDEFAKTIPAGDFSKSLSSALGRGISMDQAMKNAAQSEVIKQQGIEIDAKSPTAGFANGKPPETQSSPEFDNAVKSAMARGVTPENAIKVATETVKSLPKEVSTPTNSLVSGKNIDTLTASHGRIFENILGSALANGMPIDVAIAKAERAELSGKAPENQNNTTISPNKH
ncbi:MAG: MBG domain-containing protein, partial [Methylococcaceae bacterium]